MKKLHSEFVLYRNVYNTQAQPDLSSSFESVHSGHCLATLDIRAANRLSHHPEPPGRPIHGEVDGLDVGRQHGQRFGLLRHTHKPQKRPYPICANRSRNVRHPCGGDWVEPTLSVAHTGILFRGVNYLMFFRLVFLFISEQLKFVMASGLIPATILHAVLGSAIPGGCFGDEGTESRSALQLFNIPPHFCFCCQMNSWASEGERRGCLAPSGFWNH